MDCCTDVKAYRAGGGGAHMCLSRSWAFRTHLSWSLFFHFAAFHSTSLPYSFSYTLNAGRSLLFPIINRTGSFTMLLTLLPFLVSVEAFFILSQPILLNTRLDP